jgi:hypothetical protein
MHRAIVLLATVAVFLLAATALSAAVYGRDFDRPWTFRSGSTAAFPDVCKTPSPRGPVPIPYVNRSEGQGISKDFPLKSAPKASSSGNRDRRPYER